LSQGECACCELFSPLCATDFLIGVLPACVLRFAKEKVSRVSLRRRWVRGGKDRRADKIY
jgi:hypothetical protein